MTATDRMRPLWISACLAALVAGCDADTPASAPDAALNSSSAGVDRQRDPAAPGGSARPAARKRGADDAIVNKPLKRAMDMAASALESIQEIDDYTCTFVKRERVDGELLPEQRLLMKVRHEPFSVYMRFMKPESLAGREAIFVEGRNEGNLVAHTTGLQGKVLGRMALEPTGFFAMIGNRYPITDAGMKKLLAKLIQLGGRDQVLRRCKVKFSQGVLVDGRPCTLVKIANPAAAGDFRLAVARIYIDQKWNLPVRFEAWEWPEGEDDASPVLVERYTYLDLKFNQKLTDRDFDPDNSAYNFP